MLSFLPGKRSHDGNMKTIDYSSNCSSIRAAMLIWIIMRSVQILTRTNHENRENLPKIKIRSKNHEQNLGQKAPINIHKRSPLTSHDHKNYTQDWTENQNFDNY